MDRRKFVKRALYAGAGLSICSGIYAWQIEPFWVDYTQVKVPVKNIPTDLIGKKLIQISDIHIGNRFDYDYIIEHFKETQNLNPDFVVYTGDFVSYENEVQFKQLSEVMKYAPRGRLGTVGVLGNHDYGDNFQDMAVGNKIAEILQNNGIEMIRNSKISIAGLEIIGIDDFWGPNFNLSAAMKLYSSAIPTIVLCHNPDVCDLPYWNNYEGWILSGHTHGGQVKPPFLSPPILPVKNRKYSSGKVIVDKRKTVYINRALGHLRQVRFNARPEITVFTLAQA